MDRVQHYRECAHPDEALPCEVCPNPAVARCPSCGNTGFCYDHLPLGRRLCLDCEHRVSAADDGAGAVVWAFTIIASSLVFLASMPAVGDSGSIFHAISSTLSTLACGWLVRTTVGQLIRWHHARRVEAFDVD